MRRKIEAKAPISNVRKITAQEGLRRLEYIANLRLQGMSGVEIFRKARVEMDIPTSTAKRLLEEIETSWASDYAEGLEEIRERQRRRLETWIAQLASARKPLKDDAGKTVTDQRGRVVKVPDVDNIHWSQIAKFEQLLSSITGTNRPIEVHHSGSLGVAVAGIIANLSEDEARTIVQQQLDTERKAALAEQFGIASLTVPNFQIVK